MQKTLETIFSEWLADFQGESDRACGVLGPAFLDEALGALLSAFLLDDPLSGELLARGVLAGGRLRVRSDLAFALGLIGAVEHGDLRIMGEIRNRFAHRAAGLSFETSTIADSCAKLRAPEELRIEIPPDALGRTRFRFVTAVVILAATIRGRIEVVKHRQPPEPMVDVEARMRRS